MGLTASLDIGNEKIVMALAAVEHGACRLVGIKIIASLSSRQNRVFKDRSTAGKPLFNYQTLRL